MSSPPTPTKRPDAATRRAQLLDAADAVFAEHGVQAPLELIVERAGVGRATLYRQFPDRRAIMLALLERSVQRLEVFAQSLRERDDAFFVLLERVAQRMAYSAAMSDYWRTSAQDDNTFEQAHTRAWQVFADAIERAQRCGLLQPHVTTADVSLLSSMLGSALRGKTPQAREALARRALQIMCDGLRTRPGGDSQS
ncbi:MAG: TetR/AcrR family transcriptional regulator [Comamonas sp.]|nr:TetR/AcrR family transcriptional regulator [Candidatus Comamonas equi]